MGDHVLPLEPLLGLCVDFSFISDHIYSGSTRFASPTRPWNAGAPHSSLSDNCNMSFKIELGFFLQENSPDTSGLVFPDTPISRMLLTFTPSQMNVCLLVQSLARGQGPGTSGLGRRVTKIKTIMLNSCSWHLTHDQALSQVPFRDYSILLFTPTLWFLPWDTWHLQSWNNLPKITHWYELQRADAEANTCNHRSTRPFPMGVAPKFDLSYVWGKKRGTEGQRLLAEINVLQSQHKISVVKHNLWFPLITSLVKILMQHRRKENAT